MFALICGGILVIGNADHIDVSGRNVELYAPHVRLYSSRFGNPPGVYDNGGQFQVTVARDHSRIWLQNDADDNPHEKGEMFRCRRK